MKFGIGLLAVAVLMGLPALADKAPVVHSVEPGEADPGAVVTAKGVSLDKTQVTAVFLSDGVQDWQVTVIEQASETLKFKVPEKLRGGRYIIVLGMAGDPPLMLEQPVKLLVTGPIGEQ
jgi:hypothetical protein